MSYSQVRLGIVGGGQLGRMLIQAAIDLNVRTKVLDPDPQAPCAAIAHEFVCGQLTDFQTVYEFGKGLDVLTIEIENINADALERLENEGVKVFPQAKWIRLFQDKRLQKQFYKDQGFPTSDFVLTEKLADLEKYTHFLPAFHKLGKAGYDGRGVQKIANSQDISKGFEAPSVLEKMIDFEKEIAVIAARNESGEIRIFPAVEMVFHPEYNLVEYLFAPAQLSESLAKTAEEIARNLLIKTELVGIFAVEMFVTKNHEILINEIALRPHNSGHHTIEANMTSQYEQHLRAILNLPLGSTQTLSAAAMVNLLGEANFSGVALYEGLEEVMAMEGTFVHLYGKTTTKPSRKMGHVTILENDLEVLKNKAEKVKNTLKVKA